MTEKVIIGLIAFWLLLPVVGYALVGGPAVMAWAIGTVVGLFTPT
jgi:hypothetical protein